MSKRDGCKTACCWVPMDGVCARKRGCRCHVSERTFQAFTDHATLAARIREDTRPRSLVDRRRS